MSPFFLARFVLLVMICSSSVYAQESESQPAVAQASEEKTNDKKIFFKFSPDYLPPVDLKDNWSAEIPSWRFEVESELQNKVISIVSLGYRKEEYKAFVGHLMNIKAGHVFEMKKSSSLSARMGMEWGSPAVKYRFSERSSLNTPSQITYIGNRPPDLLNLQTVVTLYPVIEFSVRKYSKHNLIEAGFRANILNLRTEHRVVTPQGEITTSVQRTYEAAPSFFLSVGFGVR